MDNKLKRNYSLDIARIVAVLAVVMIHCSASFVTKNKLFTPGFIVGNLFDGTACLGVPFFIMISGALFLDERKELTIKGVLSKNVKNIVIMILLWATFYSVVNYAVFPYIDNKPIDKQTIINGIIAGNYHMWYLYMLIGLYCISPFLKKFALKENPQLVLFFIVLSLIFAFIPPVVTMLCKLGLDATLVNPFLGKFRMEFFGGYIAYFLTGWYIVHVGIKKPFRYLLYFLGLVSIVCVLLYVHFTGDYKSAYGGKGGICLLIYLYSTSVFLAINTINLNLKERAAKLVVGLSKLTFGVYITHCLFLSIYPRVFSFTCHPLLQLAAIFATTVCVSFLASFILSKIPVIKKTINT